MSQTWIIKDTAPVDDDSYVLTKTDISFTSGGEKFAGIEIYDDGGALLALYYHRNNSTIKDPAALDYSVGDSQFYWNSPAYKTLEFDTAPTGELLAWLQKNADKQSEPEYLTTESELTSVADAIRAKGGTSALLVYPDGFVTAIQAIQTGGGITPGAPGDITFYDYDGTIVTSWTLAELATKTALPDYPSHEGLTCQGWNWSLADLKTTNRKMNVGAMYITDDGKTRIYIRLEEGRTSPMLGVCPNGTVTVDWGDGTTPDTLTGTNTTTVKWTPNHTYAAPGEYVIKLTVDGMMGFYGKSTYNAGGAILRYSSSGDYRNFVYQNSVQKIEIGNSVTSIGNSAFNTCYSIASITIPNGVTNIGTGVFNTCYSLASITIPNGVRVISPNTFRSCNSIASITIPNGITNIESYAFAACNSLASITIPNGITSIGNNAFDSCSRIASITIPNGITNIETGTFGSCYGVAFYDFTAYTTVPTLKYGKAFTGISADCQIRVPAALVDTWKTATNWSTYADHIVGV